MKQTDSHPCLSPKHLAPDYCSKLKSGISRLKSVIQAQHAGRLPQQSKSVEEAFAQAEASAWNTPFPSLFFPPLARLHLDDLAGGNEPTRSASGL